MRVEDLTAWPSNVGRPAPDGFVEGIYYDVPSHAYHSETHIPEMRPALSQSTASVLDAKSPRHAWAYHPRLGGSRRAPSDAFDMGHLIHDLVLGGGHIVEIEADSFRTKAARLARDAARESGAVPVKREDLNAARAVAAEIRGQLAELGLHVESLQREATIYWVEWVDDRPVQCRGRVDGLGINDLADGRWASILDLKTCRSAHPEAIRRHIDSYGYSIQHAAYTSGIERITRTARHQIDFVFAFVELTRPVVVTPARLSPQFAEVGVKRWERALRRWDACLRDNHWPGYGSITVDPPNGSLVREFERDADEPAEDER